MAIELHHLQPSHDDELSRLKARIADLEALNHDLCERVTENDDIRLHWEEIEQTMAENERIKARIKKLEHALQEFAQCGAVILRIMETIEKEIEQWNA